MAEEGRERDKAANVEYKVQDAKKSRARALGSMARQRSRSRRPRSRPRRRHRKRSPKQGQKKEQMRSEQGCIEKHSNSSRSARAQSKTKLSEVMEFKHKICTKARYGHAI